MFASLEKKRDLFRFPEILSISGSPCITNIHYNMKTILKETLSCASAVHVLKDVSTPLWWE